MKVLSKIMYCKSSSSIGCGGRDRVLYVLHSFASAAVLLMHALVAGPMDIQLSTRWYEDSTVKTAYTNIFTCRFFHRFMYRWQFCDVLNFRLMACIKDNTHKEISYFNTLVGLLFHRHIVMREIRKNKITAKNSATCTVLLNNRSSYLVMLVTAKTTYFNPKGCYLIF